MKPQALIVLLALLFLSLGAMAAVTQIGEAISYSITTKARSQAAREAQIRQERRDYHQLQIQEARSLAPAKTAAKQALIITGAIVTSVLIVAGGGALSLYVVRLSAAAAKRADMRASLIQLDRSSRQYPLFAYEVRGALRVYNANTGQLIKIDGSQAPLPQLVAGSQAVQLAGVIAQSGIEPAPALKSLPGAVLKNSAPDNQAPSFTAPAPNQSLLGSRIGE